jgi:hypothetical protein
MAAKDSFPLVRLALPTKASRFQSDARALHRAGESKEARHYRDGEDRCDQRKSLDDFMRLLEANNAGTPRRHGVVTFPGNIRTKV